MSITMSTVQERRSKLFRQLQRTGPDVFDQSCWFDDDDDGSSGLVTLGLDEGVTVDRILEITLEQGCGTSACLAGHGASLMAPTRQEWELIDATDVADYFKMPTTWFDSIIDHPHPFAEAHAQFIGAGIPHNVSEWLVQMAAIQSLIFCTRTAFAKTQQPGSTDADEFWEAWGEAILRDVTIGANR